MAPPHHAAVAAQVRAAVCVVRTTAMSRMCVWLCVCLPCGCGCGCGCVWLCVCLRVDVAVWLWLCGSVWLCVAVQTLLPHLPLLATMDSIPSTLEAMTLVVPAMTTRLALDPPLHPPQHQHRHPLQHPPQRSFLLLLLLPPPPLPRLLLRQTRSIRSLHRRRPLPLCLPPSTPTIRGACSALISARLCPALLAPVLVAAPSPARCLRPRPRPRT